VSEPVVRCRGCGVLSVGELDECRSCGTKLVRSGAGAALDPAIIPGHAREVAASRARRLPGVARVFGATLAISIAATIAARVGAPDVLVDAFGSVAFVVMAIVCALAARAEVGPLLFSTGGWRGVVGAVGGLGVMVALGAVYFRTLGALGIPFHDPSRTYVEAGWPRWAPFVFISILPGIFEEIAFRGYVMARLDELLSPAETLVVQAALFSFAHLGVTIFPSHFGIGLLLGLIRRRTGSLYPGMAVHASWNGLIVWAALMGRTFP
jgi:membrane protease YdiL (CAAX protease family)